MVDKAQIHRAIDELSPSELAKVSEYIEFLQFKEERKDPDWFGKLRDSFAPVREDITASGMTDDEVNEVLDEALEEVRRE